MVKEEVTMKKVEIISGDYRFVGRLLEDEAPETCRVFLDMLPLKSSFIHVIWSGEGIWIPYGDMRTGLDYENHTSHPAKGEMLLYPGGISEMEIIMSYGRCMFASQHGQLSGNHFLTVEEGIEDIYEFGRKVLYECEQPIEIRLID